MEPFYNRLSVGITDICIKCVTLFHCLCDSPKLLDKWFSVLCYIIRLSAVVEEVHRYSSKSKSNGQSKNSYN